MAILVQLSCTMKKDLVIGMDCSTTACKAIAWSPGGEIVAQGRYPIPMNRPHLGWHEQPAETWWDAACQALKAVIQEIDPARLAGMAMAVQRETFVPVDEKGQPLRPGIVWMDERARALLPELSQAPGREMVHLISGKPLSGNLSLSKIAWLKQFEPGIFSRARYYQDVHAYLVTALTGEFKTSWGCADPMGLFDMRQGAWSQELLQGIGIDRSQMPAAYAPASFLGEVTPEAASATGLPAGLPVFAGIGDGQAGALGVGLAPSGQTAINLGTAAVSATGSKDYLTDPAFRTTYSGIPGYYLLETVLLGGTYTVTWFIERFGQSILFEDLRQAKPEDAWEHQAAQVSPGSQGLMLVPYWNSAMSPYWNASASGMVVGWRGIHGPAHFYRAILEGIAYELKFQLEGVERVLHNTYPGLAPSPAARKPGYLLFGGGANSRLWRQILADVFGRPFYLSPVIEATSLGAGILAAQGAGWFVDVPTAMQSMTHASQETVEPNQATQAIYSRLYEEVYRNLYPAFQASLDRLTELSEDH